MFTHGSNEFQDPQNRRTTLHSTRRILDLAKTLYFRVFWKAPVRSSTYFCWSNIKQKPKRTPSASVWFLCKVGRLFDVQICPTVIWNVFFISCGWHETVEVLSVLWRESAEACRNLWILGRGNKAQKKWFLIHQYSESYHYCPKSIF